MTLQIFAPVTTALRRWCGPLLILLCLLAISSVQAPYSLAQDQDGAEARSPLSLPASAGADTLRTNIWLTEALMAEIVTASARVLPPPPAAIQVTQQRPLDEDDLFKSAVMRVLGGMGYEIYVGDEDPARQAAVDCNYTFTVHGVMLEYPEVGRTIGLWRQWVDRELTVSAQVDITMADSGRLLLSDRIARTFGDRVPGGDFDKVDSGLFGFTTAEMQESGWKGRLEEIVVLGTLAGLVAVYFSNTGD